MVLSPTIPSIKYITCPVFRELYQLIHASIQLTILETDLDLIGLDLFSNTEKNSHNN